MVGSQIPEIAPPATDTTMIEPGYVSIGIVADNSFDGTANRLNDGSTSDRCALGDGDSVTVDGHTAADGMRVWIPGAHSASVDVVDTSTGKVVATILLENPGSDGWCSFPFPTIITGNVRLIGRDDYVNLYELELHNTGVAPHRHNL